MTTVSNNINELTLLYNIQETSPVSNVVLSYAQKTYDIDLNSRIINGPSTLSVYSDHKSTTIYFKIDRYFDYMDLVNTTCVIEYIVPEDSTRVPYIYIVPFYDITTYADENKIIFPWSISNSVTSKKGKIEYAIRFYKIDRENNEPKIIYNLNTLPASSIILPGLNINEETMHQVYDDNLTPSQFDDLIDQFQNSQTYWRILDGD